MGQELDAMHQGDVTEQEVSRAKALILTDLTSSLQSAQSRADKLSQFATLLGDPALLNREFERFNAVSADDVRRVCRARLGRDNRASLLYVPRTGGETRSA